MTCQKRRRDAFLKNSSEKKSETNKHQNALLELLLVISLSSDSAQKVGMMFEKREYEKDYSIAKVKLPKVVLV